MFITVNDKAVRPIMAPNLILNVTLLFIWVVTSCILVGSPEEYVSQKKCWYLPTSLHGVTNQQTNIVILILS
jgi:hypothetical protein